MFTGIIETMGIIEGTEARGSNRSFWVSSPISQELKVDQSVSHSGVCLTIEELKGGMHRVTAIRETLEKTSLKGWEKGKIVNLERCLPLNGRLDGHFVQGHVDCTAICTEKKEKRGSWEYEFEIPGKFTHLIVEKGSICVNGISLTLFDVKKKSFRVAIIPYTFEHTDFGKLANKTEVNIEFDIIGKYVSRIMRKS